MDEPVLIEKLRRGDEEACRQFVEQYQKQIWLLARKLTGDPDHADDIAQDVFLKAFESIDTFEQRSTLHTWLHRITINRYLSEQRIPAERRIRYHGINIPASDGRSGSTDDLPFDENETGRPVDGELSKRLENALLKLSDGQRIAFELKYREGHQVSEVASIMGVTAGTVKSHLFRALEKLRRELSGSQKCKNRN